MTSPPFPQLRTYLMDVLFLNQKINSNIRISYSLKYKHLKKSKFFNSHTRSKILHLILVTLSLIALQYTLNIFLSQCFGNIWWEYSGQMFFQSHVVDKIFQNLRVRLKFIIGWAMKIKLFVAFEIQYFELRIFSFNSHIYYWLVVLLLELVLLIS